MNPVTSPASGLPAPDPDALAHGERMAGHIRDEIASSAGWISFERYMDLALYTPGLGYYSAGAKKLGAAGDFITAPELSPLFGHTLARQVREVLDNDLQEILEVGAGSGALAASLLEELERLDALPKRYLILELSADLRERSRDTLAARVPHLLERVAWLNQLPPSFCGVVLGNEVLDAMPVRLVHQISGRVDEIGVEFAEGGFCFAPRPAAKELQLAVANLSLPNDYRTELCLASLGFVRSLATCLEKGAVIFIDYGFVASEYHHPQRSEGTLMCHYRHRAHADPFFLPGLQDITAHVDFSAIAAAAAEGGLQLAGFATQAQFLINCGITDILARVPASDAQRYLPLSNQANRLLSSAEMGDLFKVIAFSRGLTQPLMGFAKGDRRQGL
ncbi:MAG: class I SAM-dependent methyltransferase [Betaproteobacteria bacterium]|nr:class I SAM-dependent methyltransferase [Betaproteobacteria bacterium]